MPDRKSTRLNSSHTVIYTLSLHDALPIYTIFFGTDTHNAPRQPTPEDPKLYTKHSCAVIAVDARSEEHTSELQSHRDLHSFPTRRSSDLHHLLRHGYAQRPTPADAGGSQALHQTLLCRHSRRC